MVEVYDTLEIGNIFLFQEDVRRASITPRNGKRTDGSTGHSGSAVTRWYAGSSPTDLRQFDDTQSVGGDWSHQYRRDATSAR